MFDCSKQAGFTLVEVLIATAIFLLIALSLSALFINSYRTIGLAGNRGTFVAEAQQEMERAIADDTYQTDELVREDEYEIVLFGRVFTGTLVSIEKQYSENRRVHYLTFVAE